MTAPAIHLVSTDPPAEVFACGTCRGITSDQASAEKCCVCADCGGLTAGRTPYCNLCGNRNAEAKEAKRRAKIKSAPATEGHTGPVFVVDLNRFFPEPQAAAEAVYDDELDPEAVLVHPCDVVTVPVPDLHQYVEESWAMEFTDDSFDELSKKAAEAIEACTAVLLTEAPECWHPVTEAWIRLPALKVVS